MGYDKHLFLLEPQLVDITGLTVFYESVLQAWQVLTHKRSGETTPGMWLFEEPLLGGKLITSQALTSVSLRTRLREAGCVKLGHLVKISIPHLAELTHIRSNRLLLRLVEEVCASLPEGFRSFVKDRSLSDQWDGGCEYAFPPLDVSAAAGQWTAGEDTLLSLKTPQLGDFESLGRKAAYQVSVKVSNLRSLTGVKVSRWVDFFGRKCSPGGCWRSLYKPPVDKRTGDLQWRVVHGAIATNKYLVHLDPGGGDKCPFCPLPETVYHLFAECSRLKGLFKRLQAWFRGLGEQFSLPLFIYGPKYSARKKNVHTLLNFLSGMSKLAIWKTRQNRVRGGGSEDANLMLTGLLAARLRVEFGYYKLTNNTELFVTIWGLKNLLCSVSENALVIHL